MAIYYVRINQYNIGIYCINNTTMITLTNYITSIISKCYIVLFIYGLLVAILNKALDLSMGARSSNEDSDFKD